MMLVEDMLVAAADGQRGAGVSSADLFFLSSSASFDAMQAGMGTVAGQDNDKDSDDGDDGGGGGVEEEVANTYGCAYGQGGTVSWSACEDRVGLHHITTNTTATPQGSGPAATIDGGCSRTARLTSRPFFADDGDAPQQSQPQQQSFVMDGGAWDSWIASLSTTQNEALFALQATTVEDGFSLPTNQQTPASASASSASTLASFSWRLDDSPTSTAASMEPSTPTTPSWARATVGEVVQQQQQQQQHEAAPPTKKGDWPWQSMLDATAALSTANKDERCFECGWTLASALSVAEGSSHNDEGKLRILSRHPALQANDAGRAYLCSRCARSDKYELLSTKEAQRRFRLKRKGASELLRQVPHVRVGSSKKYWVHHLQWVADCSQALAGPDDDVVVDGAEDVAKAAPQPATKQRQQQHQNDDSTKRKKRARTASAQHHGAAASPWEMALAMSGVIMPVTLTMSGSCSQAPVSHQDTLPREPQQQQQQDNDDEAARAEAFLAQFRYTDLFGHLEAASWAAPSFDWPSTGESDCLGLVAESMSLCAPPPRSLTDAVGEPLEECEASCTSTPFYTDDNGPGDEEDSDSEDSEDVLSAQEVKQRAAQRKVELDQIRRDVRLEHLFSAMKRLDRGPCHADADADADVKCNDDDEDSGSNGNDRSTTHEEMFDWISTRAGAQHQEALHAFVAGRWKELDERCGGMGPCEVERMAAYLSHNPPQPQQKGPAAEAPAETPAEVAAVAPTEEDGPPPRPPHSNGYPFETLVSLH